jgi:hypothetical protein
LQGHNKNFPRKSSPKPNARPGFETAFVQTWACHEAAQQGGSKISMLTQ